MIDTLSTAEISKTAEEAFIRHKNIKFDRHFLLITIQLLGETAD